MSEPTEKPLKAIVLGAGYRGRAYAAYATAHPGQLAIVGVADPAQAEAIAAPRYWTDWRTALAERPEADVIVISMPDALHYEAAMAALDAGYHLLLEKPISPTEAECRAVIAKALERKRLVMVGHILRYTRYFAHIKALLDSGELGEIVSIAHQESAGFFKVAHSFCRGNLANSKRNSPIILTKCSHDFDLFAWWIGRPCRRVTSFGSIREFRPENRPVGAAERCLDCPAEIERKCVWSAKKLYLKYDVLKYLFTDKSDEAMARVVRETNYGKCVYCCDNDVPDHQCVNLEFEGGVTVSHVMTGFTGRNVRTTRISCTRGEIVGDGEKLDICRFDGGTADADAPMRLCVDNPSRHGGGDFNLVAELIRLLRKGDADEIRATTEQSLASHLIAFAADRSRLAGGKVIEL